MTKVIIAFLLLTLLFLKQDLHSPPSKTDTKDKIYSKFQEDLTNVESDLKVLSQMNHDVRDASAAYQDLRNNFKKAEPLLYYLFKQEYNQYLNGAPLPKLEPNVPEITIIPPKGLQRLDEVMNEEPIDTQAVTTITHDMIKSIQYIKKIIPSIKIQDRYILEATRSQLIRIASLSLSGFDTPGGSNYLNDILANIATLRHAFSLYEQGEIVRKLDAFAHAIEKNQHRDVIDASDLIRNHINPIYAAILDFHMTSGIEHVSEVSDQMLHVNYYAENIFDEDFLNASTYSRLVPTPHYKQQAELGSMLFYDPIMSKDFRTTCATCHDPKLAFTDGQKAMRSDQASSRTNRNTPTLINAIYNRKYFHDMRASKPDLQIDHVVYNTQEFDMNYSELIQRLKDEERYIQKFAEAFPDKGEKITRYTITSSITQYVTSLSGFDSSFDQYMNGSTDHINKEVLEGFNLFMGKGACGSCHFLPTFSGLVPPGYDESESEILGVLANNNFDEPLLDQDPGRMQNGNVAEQAEIYHRSFKTPTLRNVSLTAPYMHNGVHQTLEEVMTFYNNGGGQGMGLDVPYQTLPADSLALSPLEIKQVITFMESLVDTTGMTTVP